MAQIARVARMGRGHHLRPCCQASSSTARLHDMVLAEYLDGDLLDGHAVVVHILRAQFTEAAGGGLVIRRDDLMIAARKGV